MSTRPLLMIPGPVEISPAVLAACSGPPPGHLSPPVMAAFSSALGRMRAVWRSTDDSQPFVVAGSGTTAMDMAAANLVEVGDSVLVVHTGFFSDRMAEMLRRRGARVCSVSAPPGGVPETEEVAEALDDMKREGSPAQALFATHVDTSTGVRIDPEPLARLARQHGALSVFDGVCATGGQRFEMAAWDADVYLTGSQKAIGLPPGLALLVASPRALARRNALRASVPMGLDWLEWQPVMKAYEEKRPAYFATPATPLILGLDVALGEILEHGVEARWAAHARVACAITAAWNTLGLLPVPVEPRFQAHTLSALKYPAGVDASLVGKIAAHGVTVAGGLHPEIRNTYFRVGHMGYAITRPDMLLCTVDAVEAGLSECGHKVERGVAVAALKAALGA
jgi:alanine-glyoxylate transaminase/serine-glyoxylate transaminase/serine-pyruvate transaminase